MKRDLNTLNCMNYHVSHNNEGDYWYAQNGLRSLYEYAIRSNKSFRELCLEMIDKGEVTINYHIQAHELGIDNPELNTCELTLTMI